MCVYPDEDLDSAFVMTDKVLGSDKILGRWDSMLNSHTSTRGINYYTLDTSVKPNYNSVDYAEDTSTVDQKWEYICNSSIKKIQPNKNTRYGSC